MFESISRSIGLVKESWKVLSLDKEILLFPVLSGIALLLVVISFIIPALFIGFGSHGGASGIDGLLIVGIFLFYLFCYFVVIFFNTALITCARIRLTGGDPTFMDGIHNAVGHIRQIFVWAIVSATIGLILHALQNRSGLIGQVVIGLIGAAWSLVTYFVVPVMIFEEKGTWASIKESVELFRKTWGESLVGQISISLIFMILGVLGLAPLFIAVFTGSYGLVLPLLAVFIVWILILAVIGSALQGIYNTALYLYASTGTVPTAFSKDAVENAFAPKLVGGMRGNI